MLNRKTHEIDALGRGVYSSAEALRLINFSRGQGITRRSVSGQTISRWLNGYDYEVSGEKRHSAPLWRSDYANDDGAVQEISFRDLIELRFVKTFRDLGLSLPTIRDCFIRAVEEVNDERPFSTQKFRTDGKTIFLDIMRGVHEGELIDLRRKQSVFRSIVAPSLQDLEFDADELARWFPFGNGRASIVIDPARSFGRPVIREAGVPTETLASAVRVEGSIENVARLYEVSLLAVRDALEFEQKLAA
ncbi:DUF433 domain-containing protein [Methylocapsa sp. D3K7]|uniref:DUF433 domain-containing protein n=1 Tax=Methylocapsa sp. D3K7 TaxID=3041435 RepID=UPI00244EAF9E|nr:DUF433 domain-containing protein [Methylocapsa sp. D3K7]WGJ15034.1 DUF433 domain-containing protein [Methylocapsa sp. D3K7]